VASLYHLVKIWIKIMLNIFFIFFSKNITRKWIYFLIFF
jgi:hypothetical protein